MPIPPRPLGLIRAPIRRESSRADLRRFYACSRVWRSTSHDRATSSGGRTGRRPSRRRRRRSSPSSFSSLPALLVIVTLGGWDRLRELRRRRHDPGLGGLYVLFAVLVMRWNRGILPVAAALAIIMAIFAAIAAPHWFARDKAGLSTPLSPRTCSACSRSSWSPVQLVLVAVAMFGFNQEWHVEEERPDSGRGRFARRLPGRRPRRAAGKPPRGGRRAGGGRRHRRASLRPAASDVEPPPDAR